jgi:hypothetical protein
LSSITFMGEADESERRRATRTAGIFEIDLAAHEFVGEHVAEEVGRDAAEEAGRHAEAAGGERDIVGRAADRRTVAVAALGVLGRQEVDQRFATRHDHFGHPSAELMLCHLSEADHRAKGEAGRRRDPSRISVTGLASAMAYKRRRSLVHGSAGEA